MNTTNSWLNFVIIHLLMMEMCCFFIRFVSTRWNKFNNEFGPNWIFHLLFKFKANNNNKRINDAIDGVHDLKMIYLCVHLHYPWIRMKSGIFIKRCINFAVKPLIMAKCYRQKASFMRVLKCHFIRGIRIRFI